MKRLDKLRRSVRTDDDANLENIFTGRNHSWKLGEFKLAYLWSDLNLIW